MMMPRTPVLVGAASLLLAVGATTYVLVGSGSAAPDPAQPPIALDRAEPIPMTVYLTPTCGCCAGWVEHLAAHGFEVSLQYMDDLAPTKERLGVTPEISSCHTAVVNGYVVEGHVPGDVVRRLLAEAPEVAGIAAPGMPVGSPGMEVGGQVDPYDVIAFTSDGRTRVYSEEGR
jgi:hypothetical protein